MTEPVDILLIEDNPADIELTVHALRKERLTNRIDVVRDGEEALDYLFCRGAYAERTFQNPPRLVLLDLKLPKVDGLDVLRAIKRDPRTQAIPVVVLTSSREEADMIESYQLAANAYLQKPVDFDEFREIIRQVGLFWLVVNLPPPKAAFPNKLNEGSGSRGKV